MDVKNAIKNVMKDELASICASFSKTAHNAFDGYYKRSELENER